MKNFVTTRLFRLGLPVTFLLLCTLVIWLTEADLRLARAVYESGKGWPGIGRFPWDLLYEYANAPAFLLALLARGILLSGFWLRESGQMPETGPVSPPAAPPGSWQPGSKKGIATKSRV